MQIVENIEKVPYKFIYSSFPNRGLLELLQMWPKIIEKYPTASLHIYSDIYGKWVNDVEGPKMKTIASLLDNYKNVDGGLNIHYHGWVGKEELAEGWKTAEYWFYPCTFAETFCLTALEAALSKTLAISNGLAALQNTIGERGITIPGDTHTTEWQQAALYELFAIMENTKKRNELIEMNYKWASSMSWESQAHKLLNQHLLQQISSDNDDDATKEKDINILYNINNDVSHLNILKIGAFKGNVVNDHLFNSITSATSIIFVEPVTKYFTELVKNYDSKYPNNKFKYLNKAVSNKIGRLGIYCPSITNDFKSLPWWIEQLASCNPEHFKNHGYDIDLDLFHVPTTTINQIVLDNNIKNIDYLCVDTEGHDFDILMDMDLTKMKPTYISFEHLHMDGYKNQGEKYDELIKHLTNNNYEIIKKTNDDTYLKLQE